MTNEEARAYFIDNNEKIISVAKDENIYNYETQQVEDVFMRRTFEANELAIKALEQKPKSEWEHDHDILKAYSDGANDVLDEIKADIEQEYKVESEHPYGQGLSRALEIIDRYKAEGSDKV